MSHWNRGDWLFMVATVCAFAIVLYVLFGRLLPGVR